MERAGDEGGGDLATRTTHKPPDILDRAPWCLLTGFTELSAVSLSSPAEAGA